VVVVALTHCTIAIAYVLPLVWSKGMHTMFTPSLIQAMLYSSVQGDVVHKHDDAEQHSVESSTPFAKIDVAAPARAVPKEMVFPFRTIVLAHVRTNDVPHGDALINPSPPIMHNVPCGTLLHPALAPWAESHGS
jgi:hypothetical protein